MLYVNPNISIPDQELHEDFIRSSGHGGQNVNKVSTAVQLRFDVAHSSSLPDDVRERLIALAGNRVTAEGILIISARRFRTQERNRQDARDRLVELLRRAAEPPTTRVPTRTPAGIKTRRLEAKRRRGTVKKLRQEVEEEKE